MELRRYVRDRHGHPIGVIVATARNEVGWSLCARSHGDHFDYEKGITIALNRAANGFDPAKIPASIRDEFAKMLERSQAYFK